MKLLRSYFVLLVIALLAISDLSAQSRYATRFGYFRVGVAVGATNYLGDLDDDLTFKFSKPGVGLEGSFKFHPHMSGRVQVFQGWASATDEKNKAGTGRRVRNLNFRTPIREASVVLVYDFFATDRHYKHRPKYNPYIFGGFGVFQFNPQGKLNDEWVDLQPLGTEGQFLPDPNDEYPDPYALTQICLPIGGGMRIALAKNWDLEVEIGWRKIFTDYLDDVSTNYPDLVALQAQNPTAFVMSDRGLNGGVAGRPAGHIRGDQTQDDWYIFSTVKITYILDWVKCPSFR